jgi:ligand-binding SRPBCC domain-containing protein
MPLYQLRRKQNLPISIERCWDFFSSPRNLKEITPKYLQFEIISDDDRKIYPGQLVQYYVRPVWNIRVYWLTEITHAVEKKYFVDEQKCGPYAFWHHKHFFKEIEKGVEMEDVVDYGLPFGIVGQALHVLVLQNRLNKIFDYRRDKLTALFGTVNSCSDDRIFD